VRSALVIVAVLAACSGSERSTRPSNEVRTIDVQGHRGARGLAPENTLLGFERALAIGVTTLELDVGMTADGVLVVSHDPELGPELARRTGSYIDSPVAIFELSRDQIRDYDVGRIAPNSAYAKRFPDQAGADGIAIPTLEEVFELGERRSGGTIRYNVETKLDPTRPQLTASPEVMTRALLSAIERRGLGKRVTVQSFDWRSLRIVAREAPQIELACLTSQRDDDTVGRGQPGPSPWLGGIDVDDHPHLAAAVKAVGCAIWSPSFRDLSATRLAQAHGLGLRVIPWTVNEPADIRAVVGLGVDGVISDYPDRVRSELARRGWPLPVVHSP
jgi:glycerophosphoryl diester phosphodiesterase